MKVCYLKKNNYFSLFDGEMCVVYVYWYTYLEFS